MTESLLWPIVSDLMLLKGISVPLVAANKTAKIIPQNYVPNREARPRLTALAEVVREIYLIG